MHRSTCFKLRTRDVGRQLSDDLWERLDPVHIQAWLDMESTLCTETFDRSDSTFHLRVDFSDAIDRLRNRYHLMQRIYIEKDQAAFSEFKHEVIELSFYLEEVSPARSRFSPANDIAEYMVYETFQALNISAPGCCDFSDAQLHCHPKYYNVYGTEITTDISLSGRHYESAIYESDQRAWLEISNLPVATTLRWMRSVNPLFSMTPANPSAKSLFALHHLCKGNAGPASLIWVFYGLESLFQCRPGENFRCLTERITAFLDLDRPSADALRKRLRKLYDLRSSFVHGGHRVSHPLWNGLQEEDETPFIYYVESDFGVALLLCCIQRLIKLGWSYPTFREVLEEGHI